MRFFIYLSYDGGRYHGWQVQPNGISVQQTLEECLSTVMRREIGVTGAGRTDAGVHASMMVAHFDWDNNNPGTPLSLITEDGLLNTAQLSYRLNRILPHDIAIQRIVQVPDDFHARFSATARTYYYFLHDVKDPFLCQYSYRTHFNLDFQAMNRAAELLLSHSDFAAFCKSHTDVKTTFCHVTRAEWQQIDDHRWRFVITANRFLRNMVRAVVGTLVEVGRHRMTLDDFQRVLNGRKRTAAGESMPANALFLADIVYPDTNTSPTSPSNTNLTLKYQTSPSKIEGAGGSVMK